AVVPDAGDGALGVAGGAETVVSFRLSWKFRYVVVASYAEFQSRPWRVAAAWNSSKTWSRRTPSHHPSIVVPSVRTSSRCIVPGCSGTGSGSLATNTQVPACRR